MSGNGRSGADGSTSADQGPAGSTGRGRERAAGRYGATDEIADRLADLGQFIKGQREIASMSVRRLADLAGVSNPYLSQIERGLRRPSAEILQQIANALKISVETLYVRAGLLSEDPDAVGSRTRDAIINDTLLTDDQKQALLNVYDSFVGGPPTG